MAEIGFFAADFALDGTRGGVVLGAALLFLPLKQINQNTKSISHNKIKQIKRRGYLVSFNILFFPSMGIQLFPGSHFCFADTTIDIRSRTMSGFHMDIQQPSVLELVSTGAREETLELLHFVVPVPHVLFQG